MESRSRPSPKAQPDLWDWPGRRARRGGRQGGVERGKKKDNELVSWTEKLERRRKSVDKRRMEPDRQSCILTGINDTD